jgi:hypothetical protein
MLTTNDRVTLRTQSSPQPAASTAQQTTLLDPGCCATTHTASLQSTFIFQYNKQHHMASCWLLFSNSVSVSITTDDCHVGLL